MENLLKKLLDSEDKIISCDEEFGIRRTKLIDDMDLIMVELQRNNSIYKDIFLVKGLTFPIPKIGEIFKVKKLYLKHNREYKLNLFIEGQTIPSSAYTEKDGFIENFSFEDKQIIQTISKLTKENFKETYSQLFIIDNILNNEKVVVKSISNANKYILLTKKKQTKKFKTNDFLWISFYELDKNEIKENKMTMFEILTEEKLIDLADSDELENIKLFQVVDLTENDIVLVDRKNKLYNLNKKDKFIKNQNINFYQPIMISNFIIKDEKRVELNDNSFLHLFKTEAYYIENILTTLQCILEFHILDFKKDNNRLDCIILPFLDNKKKIISNEIEYMIFESYLLKKYEFYPFEIMLSNSMNEEINPIKFTYYLYPGVINKINLFINTNSPKTYFYEYLYYNIDNILLNTEKNIDINGLKYKITIQDNYGSKNRSRISIMNIPYQRMEVDEKDLNNNSLQVCELIKNDFHKIIGIYDIIYEFKEKEKCNDFFDEYYEKYGDIYDNIKLFNLENMEANINILIEKEKEFNKKNFENILDANNFNDSMTLSQFKSWFGIIICKFINNKNEKKNIYSVVKDIILNAFQMLCIIKNENLRYIDIIRIMIYYLKEKIMKSTDSAPRIEFISHLEKNSPYVIGFEFNKRQINSLNEFHTLFQAYLQLDSYKAYNYLYSDETYTFSLESEFMIKKQLLSTYEDFFFIKRENNNQYSLIDKKTSITIINELKTFGDNYEEKKVLNDPKEAKNYAVQVSIDFLHEKSGHHKFSLKNRNDISPCIYFRGLKIEFEIVHIYKEGLLWGGETGRIIENFICKDKIIIEALSSLPNFGEFLEDKYFQEKDFISLIEGVKKKINYNKNKENIKSSYADVYNNNANGYDKVLTNFNNKRYISLDLPPSGIIGDVIIDVDTIKRHITLSNEEKEAIDKENIINKSKRLLNLKKRKKVVT